MKSLLTATATLFAILAISSTAQASPSFSKCVLNTSGGTSSVTFVGGGTTRGVLKCKKTNAKGWKRQKVVLPMFGFDLGLQKNNPVSLIGRTCNVNINLRLVGAELNVNLTPKKLRRLLRAMVIAEVIKPWKPNQTAAVSVGVNNAEFGVHAGLGTVTYSNCYQLASLKFGTLVKASKYDKMMADHKKAMAERAFNK